MPSRSAGCPRQGAGRIHRDGRGADPGEKALERSAAGHPNSALRFYILRDLEGCWDDEGLKTAIFEEMIAPDLTPAEYAAAPGRAAWGGVRTRHRPCSALSEPDRDVPPIAKVILARAPVGVWPALWARLAQDDELARAILLYAAGQFHFARRFMLASARRRSPISTC